MIPAPFARSTTEREGEAGAAWLAELPGIVDHLLTRWNCVLDGAVLHGQVGLIVPVRRTSGPAVLKVSFPHPGNAHEPAAFAAWGGRGGALRSACWSFRGPAGGGGECGLALVDELAISWS
ncbi:hypothetical protein Kfla_4850 [Kribbella flavida DSM 17836]|uniref:Streptomycin 6-kinase n=1 Tax=Kribbella flavida (strain DSM 17836 / JCM 10339 / NBRC 14399) TaxID=479435 RepID=D2Q0R6_KRIFD|nr:hypothetical protein [Kribbella flavida]ADB33866.1 hypothetical protein Kfla_4850 [Kribbella flavida DSM 17836]